MKYLLSAALIAALPGLATADETLGLSTADETLGTASSASPNLVFTLRGGVKGFPEYFGADTYKPGVDFAVGFEYLRLPNGRSFGSTDPDYIATGFAPRGSLRVIEKRSSSNNPELAGLRDVDLSVELGFGVGYRAEYFETFAVARYGVVGHESWVGELGADVIARPTDRLTLTAGPRLFLGDDTYAATYFGVTGAEAAASAFPAFSASGGPLSAGVEIGANYRLNDLWAVDGAIRYDRLINDAEASPITAAGSADQLSARIGLVRRFSVRF